jgi:hypothetical protein
MSIDSSLFLQNENVMTARRKIDLGKNFNPLDTLSLNITFRAISSFYRSSGCLITSEVTSIDIKTFKGTRESKFKNTPI